MNIYLFVYLHIYSISVLRQTQEYFSYSCMYNRGQDYGRGNRGLPVENYSKILFYMALG